MSDEEIAKIVKEIIAMLPEQYASKVANIQVFVERKPIMGSVPVQGRYQAGKQAAQFTKFLFPEKMIIYKMPLLSVSRTLDQARDRIRDAILHELTYYFGLSDQEVFKIKNQIEESKKPDQLP